MSEKRYILAGRFIDGSGGTFRRNIFLYVKDGRIKAIGPAHELPPQEGTLVDDFSHCTILPALVDCNVSLLRSPSVDQEVRTAAEKADFDKKAVMLKQHIRYCHTHGVLGVAANDDDLAKLNKTSQEQMAQKRIVDVRTSGANYLRISYSPDIEDKRNQSSLFKPEELIRILRNRGRKKAVVVANGSEHTAIALEAGCDAIEQGYGMGDENLRKMAEKEILWIPSVLRAKNSLDGAAGGGDVACRFSTRYVAPGKPVPGEEAFWKKVLGDQLSQLQLARNLGVKTAVGTGAGSTGILHGESMVEEMKLFIKAGYSLEEAIQCASDHGAVFFGMENLGALAIGRKATFLITRGTVQQLPRKLSYLESIYIDGSPSPLYRKNPFSTVSYFP